MGNFKIIILQCIVWYLMWGHHNLTTYHRSINWQMDHVAKNSTLYIIYAKELEIFSRDNDKEVLKNLLPRKKMRLKF